MEFIQNYLLAFVKLLNEMSPYLLLGFLFAGILHVYFPKEKVTKYLGTNSIRSVINAALIGIPLPLCSCGVIPTGVSFYKNGASKGSTVSFLISTPQTGIDSMLATYSLLGLPFAIFRPFIALVTGVLGGIVTNLPEKTQVQPEETLSSSTQKVDANKTKLGRLLSYAFVEFLQDISKWLIIGLLVAAFITVVLPQDFFAAYLGNEFLEMMIVLLGSIPMYVCATGSIPIAAALLAKGISPGAALVFLMAGPATNAATITVIGKTLGKKTLIIYLITIVVGALVFGGIINGFFPTIFQYSAIAEHSHHSGSLMFWVNTTSSIILTALIINGYYRKKFKRTINLSSNTQTKNMESITIKVKGMTCNHCKMNVENNLNALEGVAAIQVDLNDAKVVISGDNVNLATVKDKVESIGYVYEGVA